MAKDMVVWKQKVPKTNKTKIAKGNIMAKATKEQRFLGKSLPKMAWGAAKWAWRHPIASTALFMAPSIGKKLGQSKKFSFPEFRQFDKRGRKII